MADRETYPLINVGKAAGELKNTTIGIVTALQIEYAAVMSILPHGREVSAEEGDPPNVYWLAQVRSRLVGEHTVAVALMPDMGTNLSAVVTTHLLRDCRRIRHIIMCGIAGAVPNPAKPEDHVRLGDVVISNRLGVIQYDLIKQTAGPNREFLPHNEHRTPPRPPAQHLLHAVSRIQAGEPNRPWEPLIDAIGEANGPNWKRPADEYDRLHDWQDGMPPTEHPADCERRPGRPRIFTGPIGSANILLKDPLKRDAMRDRFGIRAVEMEGIGIADAAWYEGAGYLIVRGTCDYCNRDKGDRWQQYAALIAAAYTRIIIEVLPAGPVPPDMTPTPPDAESCDEHRILDLYNILTKAMLSLPGLQELAWRKSLVRGLGATISNEVTEDGSPKAHLDNIIRTCATIKGGMPRLRAVIRNNYSDYRAYDDVLSAIIDLETALAKSENG